jgi:hypothetical protein
MAQRQIIFTIDKDTGAVTMEAKGYAGPACKAATAPFEQLFGPVDSDTPTAEMQLKEVSQVRTGQG